MSRADDGLGFLLKYENVARYEDGEVYILDRRVYPRKVEYVRCEDYIEVAQAITDMVTQSGGPWMAAAMGMVSAARSARDLPEDEARTLLREAAYALSHARPTTSQRMVAHVESIRAVAEEALARGADPERVTLSYVEARREARYNRSRTIATYAVDLLPEDQCTLLTQCFAETLIGFVLLVARERGCDVRLIAPETRPYLQGARLTASVAVEIGVPVTLITDNMPGYVLSRGMVDAFICAADVITLDGHVVNKIGTYQIASVAHRHGVPFYVLGTPSAQNPTLDTVEIEERDPDEVLYAMGVRTAKGGVQGYYPAFDVTPPALVGAVVTEKGVFSPYDLARHFGAEVSSA
ncbi:MAG: s-methyl-5-thioribose-1-phosphate isomerase [Anaerolineae bacterium]